MLLRRDAFFHYGIHPSSITKSLQLGELFVVSNTKFCLPVRSFSEGGAPTYSCLTTTIGTTELNPVLEKN
jgi:hypothetical protein